jgi:ATP-binding cassette subfamily F protein uup
VILIDAEGLSASRPQRPLFTDVSITVRRGDRIGVVGINGCGKSTLLRQLAGELSPDSGEVRRGRGARIGVLTQDPVLPAGTVANAVGGTWQGMAILDRLGMGALLDADTNALSGGQAKRVALAALLVDEWDALILDEPTNHLDLDAVAWLEQWLADFRGGLVLVTHDRHVLDRVTTQVLELDRGRAHRHIPKGEHGGSGYAAYLAGRAERAEQAAVTEHKRRNLARTELEWLRRGAPARTSKPKARIASATAVVNVRAEHDARQGGLELGLGTQRLGSQGVELRDVAFAWPSATPGGVARPVLNGVDLTLEPGDRVGVVGPNGAGKTTLLDLIAGGREPTRGEVVRGRTVRLAVYDQTGRHLDPRSRVRELVAGDQAEPSPEQVELMRRFWFDGDAQFAPVSTLSGGERRRLQLLLTLLQQPNVLLLDEPTNDLDLDTLRALEDHLETWNGIVVVVSHDRTFLDRTVSDVLALDGEGGVRRVRGGVAGWLAERAAAAGTSPTRRLETSIPRPDQAPRVTKGRTPSTLRRLLGEAERRVAQATKERDRLAQELTDATGDHRHLGELSEKLAAAQHLVDTAEEAWLALAEEADAQGLSVS